MTLSSTTPFVVTEIDAADFTRRMFLLYPIPWLGDAAKQPGSMAYAIFYAFASQFQAISNSLVYAWTATRLNTASDIELDYFSQDFFGNSLPRKQGETDQEFRLRISALLFQPKVTRAAIKKILENYTGGNIRMIEPWNTGDTGGYDHAYYDADSEATPALYGDPGMRYSGAIQLSIPLQTGPVDIWGYDGGAAYDAFTGVYWINVNTTYISVDDVKSLITSIVAFGTVIGVQFARSFLPTLILGLSTPIATDISRADVRIYPPFSGQYIVLGNLSAAISIWFDKLATDDFDFLFEAATGSGTILNYLLLSIGVPGANREGVLPNAESSVVIYETGLNSLACLSNWNTTIFINGLLTHQATVQYKAPGVGGILDYLVYPLGPNAGHQAVAADLNEITFAAHSSPAYIPLVLPNWETACGVTPLPGDMINVQFSTPAPASGGILNWITYPITSVLWIGERVSLTSGAHQITTPIIENISQPFIIFANVNQPTTVWFTESTISGFTLKLGTDTAPGAILDYLLISTQVPGTGSIGPFTGDLAVNIPTVTASEVLVVQPSWNTTYWNGARTSNNQQIRFSAGSVGGTLNFFKYPIGANAGRLSVDINATSFQFNGNSDINHAPMIIPNWNTAVGVVPLINNQFRLEFSVPAPANAEISFVTYPLV